MWAWAESLWVNYNKELKRSVPLVTSSLGHILHSAKYSREGKVDDLDSWSVVMLLGQTWS